MNHNRLIISTLVAAALLAGGCSSRQYLMDTPTIIADGGVDPFVHTNASQQTTTTPVFVVAGRTRSDVTAPTRFYTDERSQLLRLGLATVEIGVDMDWTMLKEESLAADRSGKPEIRLTGYEEYGTLWTTVPPPDYGFDRDWTAPDADRAPAQAFAEALHEQFEQSGASTVTIYVHGFNTKFDGSLGIAAELWHYMGRRGAMLSFAWPSEHSLFKYEVDKANAAYSTRQFRKTLEFLANETSTTQINIIAHSAGNPIVVEGLRELRLIHYNLSKDELRAKTKIGRVVLAAPDMDLLQALSASLDGFGDCAQSVVMYANTKDRALSFSMKIFEAPRLGESVKALTPEEQGALAHLTSLEAVDVTVAQRHHKSFLGHSYFHQNPWVSSDLALYLAVGTRAADRGLLREDGALFWTFPEDYQEAVKGLAAELQGAER